MLGENRRGLVDERTGQSNGLTACLKPYSATWATLQQLQRASFTTRRC
jgi:hypothetical protein